MPDQRIVWCSEDGAENAGSVSFRQVGDGTTNVMLRIDYDPEGPVESAGDMLGFVGRRIDGDLKRFKEFIEERGRATGGWRGTVGQQVG